jgi:chromosome segregation ATPase
MPKPSPGVSPLVAAAAAVDQELREYDDLAREAQRISLDGEKNLARAARVLSASTSRQPHIQEKLQTLVSEIEAARVRQQASLDALVEVSRALEARATDFDTLMKRFAGVGHSAQSIQRLTAEVAALKSSGAPESQLLEGIRNLEEHMAVVVTDAEQLARDAEAQGWPEVARQADGVRQQVGAAKNKLALAYRTVAARAPS